jgi:hypothetical protein
MDFELKTYFVGLRDFFFIFLPGAMLSFLLVDVAGHLILGWRNETLEGAEGPAAFLLASCLFTNPTYLFGGFISNCCGPIVIPLEPKSELRYE